MGGHHRLSRGRSAIAQKDEKFRTLDHVLEIDCRVEVVVMYYVTSGAHLSQCP